MPVDSQSSPEWSTQFLAGRILRHLGEADPELFDAIVSGSAVRWFDEGVVAGMQTNTGAVKPTPKELLEKLRSFPLTRGHGTRREAWTFPNEFRNQVLNLENVRDRVKNLHAQAAAVFKGLLDAKAVIGDARFQDSDWRDLVTEWAYHRLHLDPATAVQEIRHLCAEALAVPVYGEMWEVDFSLQFLNGLEWPPELREVTDAIEFLKHGFQSLANYRNVPAMPMVEDLAILPGLTPEQRAELFFFIGITRLREENRIQPALDAFERAIKLAPSRPGLFAAFAETHRQPDLVFGRYDLAMRYAEDARAQAEQNDSASERAEAYSVLGAVHEEVEHWSEASDWYKKALDEDPATGARYLALGRAYLSSNHEQRALGIIDQALTADPDMRYHTLVEKARLLRLRRKYHVARSVLCQAKEQAPDRIEALLEEGSLCEELNESAKAENLYRTIIKQKPDAEDGYLAIARLYQKSGKWNRALSECQRAIDAGLATKATYIALSSLWQEKEKVEEVKQIQQKITQLDAWEKYAACCIAGSTLLSKAGRRGEKLRDDLLNLAHAEFDRAVEFDPNRAEARILLSEEAVIRSDRPALETQQKELSTRAPWAEYDGLVALGNAYRENCQGEEAEQTLKRAVDADPCRTAAWIALRDLYSWQGRLNDLARVSAELDRLNPVLAFDTEIAAGDTAFRLNYYSRAREQYLKAREYAESRNMEPDKALIALQLGQVDEAEGDFESAVANYRNAAEAAADFAPFAYAKIAALRRKLKNYREAEEAARAAIQFGSEQMDGYLELACLGVDLENTQLVDEATKGLTSAAPHGQYDLDLRLGEAYRERRNYSASRLRYDACINREPERASGFIGLGFTSLAAGDLERAEEYLTKAIHLDSANVAAYFGLSSLAEVRADLQGVIDAQNDIVRLDPTERCNACLSIGAACEQAGQLALAESEYQEAVEACPWRPDGYIRLASLIILNRERRPDEARKLYQKAKQITGLDCLSLGQLYEQQWEPQNALIVYHLGLCYEPVQNRPDLYIAAASKHKQLNQLNEAEADYKRAIKLDPTKLEAYVGLMNTFFASDNMKKARQVYERMARQPELEYEAHLIWSNVLKQIGQLDEAVESCHRAIRLDPRRIDAYLDLAELYEDQPRLGEAESVIRQAIENAPDHPAGYAALGAWCIGQKRYDEALRALQQALQRDASNPECYFNLGTVYEGKGDLASAVAMYSKATDIAPKYGSAYLALGRIYGKQKDVPSLRAMAEKVLRLDPAEEYDAILLVAEAYMQAGDTEQAERSYRQAIYKYAERAEAYSRLASLLETQKRFDESVAMYRKAAETEQNKVEASRAWQRAGELLVQHGRGEESLDALLKAASEDPSNAGAYFDLGAVYEMREDLEDAIAMYNAATQVYPHYREAYLALGRIGGRQRDPKSLARITRRIQALEPIEGFGPYDSRLWVAEVYRESGDARRTERRYRKAIQIDPRRPEAYVGLTHLLVDQGRVEEATKVCELMAEQPGIAYAGTMSLGNLLTQQDRNEEAEIAYRRGVELEPAKAEALVALAAVKSRTGRLSEAEELAQKAIELDPAEPAGYLTLGDVYVASGRYDEAVQTLEQCLKQDPSNAAVYFRLGSAHEEQGNLGNAVEMYEKASQLEPHRIAYLSLCRVYGRQKDVPGIVRVSPKIIELSSDQAEKYEGHLGIAEAYRSAELYEPAVQELKKAVELDPLRIEAHGWLGWTYSAQQKSENARAEYMEIGRLDPEAWPDVHIAIGALFLRSGDRDQAANEFRQAIELAPQRWDGYAALAQLYGESQRWEEAIRVWKDLADVSPEMAASAYVSIATIHRAQGKTEEAREACARVISLLETAPSPDHDLLRRAGLAHMMREEYADAERALSQALAANPADVQAQLYLALSLLGQGKRDQAWQQLREAIQLSRNQSDYTYPIEEAECLAAREPEVSGAKEMLEALKEASDQAA